MKDWADNCDSIEEQFKCLPEVATPCCCVFKAFLMLLKVNPNLAEKNAELTKLLENAIGAIQVSSCLTSNLGHLVNSFTVGLYVTGTIWTATC